MTPSPSVMNVSTAGTRTRRDIQQSKSRGRVNCKDEVYGKDEEDTTMKRTRARKNNEDEGYLQGQRITTGMRLRIYNNQTEQRGKLRG